MDTEITTHTALKKILKDRGISLRALAEVWRGTPGELRRKIKTGRLYLYDLKWLAETLDLTDLELRTLLNAEIENFSNTDSKTSKKII